MIHKAFYNLGVLLYGAFILVASLWNKKAKLWVSGRKNQSLEFKVSEQSAIWFHCASVGEFEQARPIIEKLSEATESPIVLSFYSPSGYELRKEYSLTKRVFYLPLDTKPKMKKLFDKLQPKMLVLIKYEFWLNMLNEAAKREIPVVLVSARFNSEQVFFKDYGTIYMKLLKKMVFISVQDMASAALLSKHHIMQAQRTGDTRFDRVIDVAGQDKQVDIGSPKRKLIVAGSTWPEDERLLLEALKKNKQHYQLLLVPHEMQNKQLVKTSSITDLNVERYSKGGRFNLETDVLLYDKMGDLSVLYRYADLAYVGGGFGQGIHNILEAAVYGLPVIFGPRNQKFIEAQEMIAKGAGLEIRNGRELEQQLEDFTNDKYRQQTGRLAKDYVMQSKGATEICTNKILTILES